MRSRVAQVADGFPCRHYHAAVTEDTRPHDTDHPDGDEGLDEFRALVRAAFEQAQANGKSDWAEMTSAVLKNRILDMTNRQFSQSRYGSPSFVHLVRRIPDLVDFVEDSPPFRLRIKLPVEQEESEASSRGPIDADSPPVLIPLPIRDWRHTRVRDDLWRATIDYDSGTIYVFDLQSGLARPREVTDPDLPEFPTIDPREVASWRQEFVSQSARFMRTAREGELQAWAEGTGRLTDLPRAVRGRWAEFTKKRVVQRLLGWFDSRGQTPPEDMLLDSEVRGLPRSEAIDEVVRTGQLRDLIIRVVRTMTFEELARLPLPAEVVLRASGRVDSRDA